MKNLSRALLRSSVWAMFSIHLVSGCGGPNESEGISASVRPVSAMITPGPDATCQDMASYQRQIVAAQDNTEETIVTLAKSLSGPVLSFPVFRLEWRSPNPVYIQVIRVTIRGTGIRDDVYETSLDLEEIQALTGVFEGKLIPQALGDGTQGYIVDTSDPNRETNSILTYARCGLKVGSIPLKDGAKTAPFTAAVTLEIIGTTMDAEYNERFVRTRVRAQAKFYGM